MTDDVQIIEGRVCRVIFNNEETGFAVIDLQPSSSSNRSTVTGILGEIHKDDLVRIAGTFDDHPRFGRQFKADSCQPVTPRTVEGIKRYLAGPRMKGIGPELAGRLVNAFGPDTLEVLDHHPARLREVPGIGAARVRSLKDTWSRQKLRREGLVFLQGHGIGPARAERIIDAFDGDVIARLRQNPYLLIERVSGIGFRTADAMAMSMGLDATSPHRVCAGVTHILDLATSSGHACLPGVTLIENTGELLGVDHDLVRDALKDLSHDGKITIARPETEPEEANKVYLSFLWEAEQEASGRLRKLIAHPDTLEARVRPHISTGFDERLSQEQVDAIRMVLKSKVTVLTGGPGVGKTTVIRTLVSTWKNAGLSVAMGCPTGRAAKRLEEIVGGSASTIHRLLEFDGHRNCFKRDANTPLEEDVIVLDETSMMDLPLFVHLLRAVRPESRLVLVGDADQLPSVGPGSVLEDLIDCRLIPIARLTKIFRQSARSGVVQLAHGILRGELPDLDQWNDNEVFFIPREDPEEGAKVVEKVVLERIPRRFGLDPENDIQILAPMHRGPVGTQALNRAIQEARNPGSHGLCFGDTEFRIGDRIIQTRNDYDRDLYNGDVGKVVRIQPKEGRLTARFHGIEHEYATGQLSDLRLAWALSVHKSQGGEYPAVVLPVFSQHFMMLHRQLLYTAITRTRRLLIIVGSRKALRRAALNDEMAARHGHLSDWISGISPAVWGSKSSLRKP